MSEFLTLVPGDAVDSSDWVKISRKAAALSRLVNEMIEDDDTESEIPLPNVSKRELLKVVDFCEHHATDPMQQIIRPIKSTDMKAIVGEWDANFIDMDDKSLFAIVLAANYLDIQDLLDLGCAKIASLIKDKTPLEIKQRFNIDPNSTPEDDEKIRAEHAWIFETS